MLFSASMTTPDPTFPPVFTGHAVNAPAKPLAEACDGVRSGVLDTGAVVWSRQEKWSGVAKRR